jgi:hypothetical protein
MLAVAAGQCPHLRFRQQPLEFSADGRVDVSSGSWSVR